MFYPSRLSPFRRPLPLLLTALLLLVGGRSVHAQSQGSGKMLGRLLDDAGKPITGATLLLNGPGYTGTAVTNSYGVYVFVDVPAGSAYTLRTKKAGYTPTSTSVRINPNYTSRYTMKLSNPRAEQEAARQAAAAARQAEASIAAVAPPTPVAVPVDDLPVASTTPVSNTNSDIDSFVDRSEGILDSMAVEAMTDALPPETEPVADEASATTAFNDVPGVLAEVIGGPQALGKAMTYPEEARRRNAEGVATVRVRIDQTGTPINAEVLRSSMNQSIDEAALETVMSVRYSPAKQRNQPVSSSLVLRLNFKLHK